MSNSQQQVATPSSANRTIAFALGGLAGSNAHGAGCLQATIDKWGSRRIPQIISCTSGQIFWVCTYLKYLDLLSHSQNPSRHFIHDAFVREQDEMKPLFNFAHSLYRYAFHDWPVPRAIWDFWEKKYPSLKLEEKLEDPCKKKAKEFLSDAVVPWNDLWFKIEPKTFIFIPLLHALMHERDWTLSVRFWYGVPDKFEFQLRHIITGLIRNFFSSWGTVLLSTHEDDFCIRHFSPGNLLPATTLNPWFVPKNLEESVDLMNESSIAIIFNSYEPTSGHESVYFNKEAGKLLEFAKSPLPNYYPLTLDSIKEALWLYMYKYQPGQRIDGAYYRAIMLRELKVADEIYVARPVNSQWKAGTPKNEQDRLNMEFSILLNGSYQAEKELLISKNSNSKIIEYEIRRSRGFWDYLLEDLTVFKDARHDFYNLLPS